MRTGFGVGVGDGVAELCCPEMLTTAQCQTSATSATSETDLVAVPRVLNINNDYAENRQLALRKKARPIRPHGHANKFAYYRFADITATRKANMLCLTTGSFTLPNSRRRSRRVGLRYYALANISTST